MSSHGGPLPDVSVQKTEIDSRLNASMLGTLMIGMYTIVYLGTMYICLSRAKPSKKVVVYAISLMYILGIANFGFEWAFMRWFFVENGDTREHIFTAILVLPRWLHVLNNLFVFIMLTLADGLLVYMEMFPCMGTFK
uniref:Uncharacterized protein n=1 Tax=Psilocybe cubensis TaxID=181762 RepID=A0A8H7XM33_PSICU